MDIVDLREVESGEATPCNLNIVVYIQILITGCEPCVLLTRGP